MNKYESYLPYCKSEKQRNIVESLMKTNSQKQTALDLGLYYTTVNQYMKRIKLQAGTQGFAPEFNMDKPAPESHIVKGVSTLYNEEGGIKQQWVKTDLAKQAQAESLRQIVANIAEELPVFKPTKVTQANCSKDLMAVYPLGDPHIGMKALKEESGQDWDLSIAKTTFLDVFDRLVTSAPHCDTAVIVNLGDYFHADNVEGVTSRSGHQLDMDSSYQDMIDIGMQIIIRMIKVALTHHKQVKVINAIGNHDDCSAMFLQVALKHMFAEEPRVDIVCDNTPYHYFTNGKSFVGVHHGHTTKADRLPLVMASDRPSDWGNSIFRTWLTGHIHHDSKKEFSGCTVESFRTLAAKDSYAAWHGWRSMQDSKALVLHKEYGEIERHTIKIKQVGTS